VVPTLVHDGAVFVESNVINEYIDETFPAPAHKPLSAPERAEMRLWTKSVDEVPHPACAEITFSSCHRHIRQATGGRVPKISHQHAADLGDAILVQSDQIAAHIQTGVA
jgi:glutathione S-transferase